MQFTSTNWTEIIISKNIFKFDMNFCFDLPWEKICKAENFQSTIYSNNERQYLKKNTFLTCYLGHVPI